MIEPLTPHADVSVGRWVLDSVRPWGVGIAWLVPPIYEAYARVLHPASAQHVHRHRHRDETSDEQLPRETIGDEQRMRWRDVAASEGTTLHPLAQWTLLKGGQQGQRDDWHYWNPEPGRMDIDELAAVASVLAWHTSTPEATFAAVWEGWGELHSEHTVLLRAVDSSDATPSVAPQPTREHPIVEAALGNPRFELPHRQALLFACDVRSFTDPTWAVRSGLGGTLDMNPIMPMAVWPADRSWYLASEIDFDSTVVGGSRTLIDGLLRLNDTDAAEVHEIGSDADLTSLGDRVN